MHKARFIVVWGIAASLLTAALVCSAPEPRPYAIFAPTLPCEQANQIAYRAVERLGYTVTSFVPALAGGRVGIVKGRREDPQTQETVTLTITCDADAVYVDTRSDNPVVASTDFTAAITDFRRGFFSLFKPLADEAQRGKTPE